MWARSPRKKNMLGEMRTGPSFRQLQHVKAGEKRRGLWKRGRKPGSQWQKSQGKEVPRRKIDDAQLVWEIKVDEYGKPAPEKAAWSLQEAQE